MCSPAGGPSRLKILVTLKADAEYTLKGNTDVRLRFTEPMTTEVMDNLTTPVRVMMHSVFSKSTLVPKGINFGPMVYATSKERTFELTNTGEFDFNFSLRKFGDAPGGAPPPAAAAARLIDLLTRARRLELSGTALKDETPAPVLPTPKE